MKRVLILMVLVLLAVGDAAAQKYYIPRFKKTKIERDYELENMKHKVAINMGGSYNICMGMQNVIKYQDLILNGEIYTPDHNDKNLTLSGVKNDNEALILAGNYLNPTGSWKITPPFADAVIMMY